MLLYERAARGLKLERSGVAAVPGRTSLTWSRAEVSACPGLCVLERLPGSLVVPRNALGWPSRVHCAGDMITGFCFYREHEGGLLYPAFSWLQAATLTDSQVAWCNAGRWRTRGNRGHTAAHVWTAPRCSRGARAEAVHPGPPPRCHPHSAQLQGRGRAAWRRAGQGAAGAPGAHGRRSVPRGGWPLAAAPAGHAATGTCAALRGQGAAVPRSGTASTEYVDFWSAMHASLFAVVRRVTKCCCWLR